MTGAREEAGCGVIAVYDGGELLTGNKKLLDTRGIEVPAVEHEGTVVYVGHCGKYAGAVVISDEIKEGAKEALASMKKIGIDKTVMLTGDREKTARAIAERLGIDEVYAGLLPADKVDRIEEIMEKSDDKHKVGFVGDGINDAPVLMRADVGIAMGALGSDAAIEASDIVLMDDDIGKIASVHKIAGKTLRIVKENIVFAISVKVIVLILGAIGFATMWLAVFADVGVAVLAILNSMRALRTD